MATDDANNQTPEEQNPRKRSRTGRAAENAARRVGESTAKKAITKKAAQSAGAKAAVQGGKTLATKAGAGATSAVSAVGQDAAEAAKNIERGDVVEAGSSATRGAATLAATIWASPIVGTIVSSVLRTRAGRALTKGITWVVLASILFTLVFFGLMMSAVTTTIYNVFTLQSSRIACVDPDGGGVPITDRAKLDIASTITTKAFEMGLGRDGAIIGVMTALAESDLRTDVYDVLQPADTPAPFKSVGIFQQMPFYWANEYWPRGTQEGTGAFNDSAYFFEAKQAILDPEYASYKFFDKFNTHPDLKNGQWRSMQPWDVAQTVQKSVFSDGSNYAARMATAKSTVATIISQNPEKYAESYIDQADNDDVTSTYAAGNPCGSYGSYAGWGGYTIAATSGSDFEDGPVIYPNTDIAIDRAMRYVGNAHLACSDGMCYRKCDHLAGDIWGYEDYSGYKSARTHWYTAVKTGVAAIGNRQPPIGALLFWDTGPSGHVATYVGNGMVVSNMNNGPNGPNVYLVPVSVFEKEWGAPYLGWADPIFRGGNPGSALKGKS